MNSLTREQFRTLLLDKKLTPRRRLMFKVGFWHGLRVTELIGLVREDILDGYVVVRRLKGSMKTHQRYQEHPDPLLDESVELRQLTHELKPGERLFPVTRRSVNGLMERMARRTGLPRHLMHPHALKHSIAMQTIKTAGIENVRQHLGHKSMASTGAYLRVSDEQASKAITEAFV